MTIPTAVMAKLATIGLSAEQAEAVAGMLSAVESATVAEAQERAEAIREKGRQRTRKWRNGDVTERHVTSPNVTERHDLSSPEVFPQTPFPNPSNPKPPSAPKGASSPTFEQFWAVYPHKVGKPDALKAFQRAGQRVDFEALMAGLHRYVAKTDDRPWCNPSTWLNQDRWADQPAVPQPRGSPARPDTPVDVADRLLNELRFANGHSDPPSDSNSQALVAFPSRAYAGQR